MPKFGSRSQHHIRTASRNLQRLFEEVVTRYDCSITQGHRGEDAQNLAVAENRSKVSWPDGKHNAYPSEAVDAAPYPIDYGGPLIQNGVLVKANLQALLRFYHFAGYVQGVASQMGIGIIWGGSWDGDFDLFDQTFMDLVHFQETDK